MNYTDFIMALVFIQGCSILFTCLKIANLNSRLKDIENKNKQA